MILQSRADELAEVKLLRLVSSLRGYGRLSQCLPRAIRMLQVHIRPCAELLALLRAPVLARPFFLSFFFFGRRPATARPWPLPQRIGSDRIVPPSSTSIRFTLRTCRSTSIHPSPSHCTRSRARPTAERSRRFSPLTTLPPPADRRRHTITRRFIAHSSCRATTNKQFSAPAHPSRST